MVWYNIQKKPFGPLNVSRIGFSFNLHDKRVYGYLDAAITVDGLEVSFVELFTSFVIGDDGISDIQFGLHGIGLEFKILPVEIAGMFYENHTDDGLEYDGYATIKFGPLMLSAIGSFAKYKSENASLFIFSALDSPLGGPGFCFVTGFSAGFGFNRDLILPAIAQTPSYWLVEQAIGPPLRPTEEQYSYDTAISGCSKRRFAEHSLQF
ncbi:MAG: DUF6603 domain-containing protein [Thiolinea sp.]